MPSVLLRKSCSPLKMLAKQEIKSKNKLNINLFKQNFQTKSLKINFCKLLFIEFTI